MGVKEVPFLFSLFPVCLRMTKCAQFSFSVCIWMPKRDPFSFPVCIWVPLAFDDPPGSPEFSYNDVVCLALLCFQ